MARWIAGDGFALDTSVSPSDPTYDLVLVSADASQVVFWATDGTWLTWTGSFVYDAYGELVDGVLDGIREETADHRLVADASGLAIPMPVYFSYAAVGDEIGFQYYVLRNADWMTGSLLADTLFGGAGDDTLEGRDGNDSLNGGDGDDTLIGGGGNDTLSAGAGLANLLDGGAGDDTYEIYAGHAWWVDGVGTTIVEAAGGGTDTVVATIGAYELPAFVENLELSGHTGYGNDLDNILRANYWGVRFEGRGGRDTLIGSPSGDTLDGGGGADHMDGGDGDDFYVVDDAGDTIIDTSGFDAVRSSISLSLPVGCEAIVLTGLSDLQAIGNSANNVLTGNAGDNLLRGLEGNDTLVDGGGADVLEGGPGDDYYDLSSQFAQVIESPGEGWDTIRTPFSRILQANEEALILTGSGTFGLGNDRNNVIIGERVRDATLSGGDGNDTLSAGWGYNTLLGGAGDDDLTSVGNDTTLDGGPGADRMTALHNFHVFVVDNPGDVVVSNSGFGRIESWLEVELPEGWDLRLLGTENLRGIGGAGNNKIWGNAGDNYIDGRGGSDALYGGDGNDVLVSAGRHEYTKVVLDGGRGVDTLIGDVGSDHFVIDDPRDIIINLDETGFGSYVDEVSSWISFTIPDDIEYITLLGDAAIDAVGNALSNRVTGNEGNNTLYGLEGGDLIRGLSGDDVIFGGDGDDSLDGGAGADVAMGGAGFDVLVSSEGGDTLMGGEDNDHYLIDHNGVVIIERPGEGTDWIDASVSLHLPDNVENLTLVENGLALDGWGNSLGNHLSGNSGPNRIFGGGGNDVIDGQGGGDVLYGEGGDDLLRGGDIMFGGTGNDTLMGDFGSQTLEGGLGIDSARFAGARGRFEIVGANGRVTVTDVAADEGTDFLSNIEYLVFDDGTYAVRDFSLPGIYDIDGDGVTSAEDGQQLALAMLDAPDWMKGLMGGREWRPDGRRVAEYVSELGDQLDVDGNGLVEMADALMIWGRLNGAGDAVLEALADPLGDRHTAADLSAFIDSHRDIPLTGVSALGLGEPWG